MLIWAITRSLETLHYGDCWSYWVVVMETGYFTFLGDWKDGSFLAADADSRPLKCGMKMTDLRITSYVCHWLVHVLLCDVSI